MEHMAHQGLSEKQCTYISLIALVPYFYWFLWHMHYLMVAKANWERGQFTQNQMQVKAWYAATDILNSAGLRNEGIVS